MFTENELFYELNIEYVKILITINLKILITITSSNYTNYINLITLIRFKIHYEITDTKIYINKYIFRRI